MIYWTIFQGGDILLQIDNNGNHSLPSTENEPPIPLHGEQFEVGRNGISCIGSRCLQIKQLPPKMIFMDLRTSYRHISKDEYAMASKAEELIFWDSNTQFCGSCGNTMKRHTEISKICNKCNKEIFPQLSPAILVLVTRDKEALLVHARNFKRPFFGLVAGFVETGENLEECVRREVKEETSLDIKNIRYFGSQTWPYPANLMIGFTAEYAGGEIRFDDNELSDGGFFSADNLPIIPMRPSLARQLIDHWLESQGVSTDNII